MKNRVVMAPLTRSRASALGVPAEYIAEYYRQRADGVAFGQLYIANPDLVERFRRGAPLNEPDQATFYTPGLAGYTDYPALAS